MVKRTPLLRYGLAVLAVALAFVLKLLVDPLIVQDTPFLLLFIAIVVSAWYGGLGPGLLATFLAAVITDYFFLSPRGAFSGPGMEVLPLGVFVLEGSLVSLLAATLRRTGHRAEASEERFRLLIEGVEDYAIFMLDPDGRIASWNAGAERIKGYRAEEILGEHFSRFYTEEDVERGHPEEELRIAAAEGRYQEEGCRLRKDGSRFWADVLITALRDETGNLRGFAKVTRDVTERRRAEQRLRETLNRLLVVYETGQMVGTSLNLEEIGSRLLQNVQRIFDLSAGVIELRDDRGEWSVLRATGPDDFLRRLRAAPEAGEARRAAIENEEPRSFELPGHKDGGRGLVGLCLPLLVRERLVGVLEAYGPQNSAEGQDLETMDSLGAQAASALENARLYEELAEREDRLRELVGQMMAAQEEERRRVAYDIHDGLAQMVAAAHAQLDSFLRHNAPATDADDRGRKKLDRATKIIDEAVREARRLIAGLRPTALDDLGLAAALRLQAEELREEGYKVEYEEALGDGGVRLPSAVETALFRVAQEALTNFRKHAQSDEVHLKLERLDGAVRLEVRDRGRGFEPHGATGRSNHKGKSIGLSSMRERVELIGGDFEVQGRPGGGTKVVAKIPLGEEGVDRER